MSKLNSIWRNMLDKIFANNFSSIYYHFNMLILEKPRYIFWCERREKTLYIFNFYTTCQVAKSKYWTLLFWPPKVHICIDRKKERGDAVRKRDHCSLEVSFIHYNIWTENGLWYPLTHIKGFQHKQAHNTVYKKYINMLTTAKYVTKEYHKLHRHMLNLI